MTVDQITYLIFGIALVLALVFDLGIMSKSQSVITIRKALFQTIFWVLLSLAFCAFLWFQKGGEVGTKYITAYLMEWSLSIDNIFVFILIFTFFRVHELDAGRALLIGILLAIVFRILFIWLGIELIDRFHWLLYVFGAFLLYTGIHLFFQKEDDEYNPADSFIYRAIQKVFRITTLQPRGRFMVRQDGKIYFTSLAIVVFMLAGTDIVFALDSIPTVVSLVREKATQPFTSDDIMVIYSSNIFAVLGLRSLFFLLRGAVDKFDYLQQGIAIVLVFIGVKMLIEFFDIHISIYISLAVIILCLGGSIAYSIYASRNNPAPLPQEDL
ncbi:TerC/Alx family metal homeostasis membrane protein [Segetibacter sp. 3557_3]|uniref:TerC/Alx family metal homeostasis membrane protein n=1 Tax=Segetibacter sp. 3557_3 TaxID=2547429 RepID=UPI0010591418|nr:TerC/Alx family metal homeostasis membrane protein [Segetibacter sp. 3557_3]TDH26085.1 TerC/Alx family metal homeostasis membrane protein [Segetibacter sp. 3557_3]